jgi:phosphohistidine phosphatase
MMRLYFMRHAQAVDVEEWRGSDAMRPLTEKGRKRARLAAEGLAHMRPGIETILSSPFSRAYETALIVGDVTGLPVAASDALRPGCTLARLDEALALRPDADAVLLVGHEPDLSVIVGLLVGNRSDGGWELKKASCACVESPAGRAADRGVEAMAGRYELAWVRTWRELAALSEP